MSLTGSPPPQPPRRSQPAVTLPRSVGWLIAANAAVFVFQNVAPIGWRKWMITELGFVPLRYGVPVHAWEWTAFVGPFSHQFLHGGMVHILINMVMLAAFGTGLARTIGSRRMLGMYVLAGLAGAAAHGLIYPESTAPVIGASGAISGLFGMVLRLLARHPQGGGMARIWPVAAIWVGISVFTGFAGMPGTGSAQVAWAAHVGGFALGFLAFDLALIGFRPHRIK